MKRENVAKKLGIASLCLAFLIPAFSGITSFATSNVAVADGTTATAIALADFVETNATVSRESFTSMKHNSTSATVTQNALTLRSSEPYSATFKTIFKGDTTFNYRFAENKTSTGATRLCGDFKFRITDVTDETNYFELIHYVRRRHSTTAKSNWTGFYLQYGNEKRTSGTAAVGSNGATANTIKTDTGASTPINDYLPHFLTYGERTTRLGKLFLDWNDAGVLTISAYTADSSNALTSTAENGKVIIAKFDGTYDTNVSQNGFVESKAQSGNCGLPKLSFPNGYKITVSSSFTDTTTSDQASDVMFTSIENGSTTYDFDSAETITKDNNMKAYDVLTAQENAGKALLGWKDTTGALYPMDTALASSDISTTYTPVFLGLDTMDGASIRIATSGDDLRSGLRFMTLFDKDDYAEAAPYIQSQGTLIAYTSALTKGCFDTVNYATDITAGTTIAQVPNTKSKMFNYNVGTKRVDDVNGQPAYSMALVGITDYTQSYSARGYLVVVYADESTQIFYTDYNQTYNSRSIAEVAWNLTQTAEFQDGDKYYNGAQKTIVEAFADKYVAAANQE